MQAADIEFLENCCQKPHCTGSACKYTSTIAPMPLLAGDFIPAHEFLSLYIGHLLDTTLTALDTSNRNIRRSWASHWGASSECH